MSQLTLEIEEAMNGRRREVVLHGDSTLKQPIVFETNSIQSEPRVWDGYVCAVIFEAMHCGTTLKIQGPLSEKFFRNIYSFQEAWQCLCPSLYQVVDIEPLRVVAGATKDVDHAGKTVAAFSGGMDSAFSLLRHHSPSPKREKHPITSALMVHGFDIPYSNQPAFDAVYKRVAPITDAVGVELHTLRTTIRDTGQNRWVHSHGSALASVLHLFSGQNDLGLIASSDPYNYISYAHYAWGSSAATDYLLSGSDMEIVHDGAGFSRPQKIAYLATNRPSQLKRTQFCWEGEKRDANCGVCDKCVHTRLSLLAGGFDDRLCFETRFHIGMLDHIIVRNDKLGDILPLLDFADSNQCDAEWTHLLRERIKPFLPPEDSLPETDLCQGGLTHHLMKSALGILGRRSPKFH